MAHPTVNSSAGRDGAARRGRFRSIYRETAHARKSLGK